MLYKLVDDAAHGTAVDGVASVLLIGIDWTVDMADARARLGNDVSLQGNVDPTVLFADKAAIEVAVRDTLRKAGHKRHILNLGHGVLVGTPEESVAHMFDLSKKISYADLLAPA
ncbi:uroporphyrinogen decarboxylase [Haematococcus lacustris]|uniref:Uroporphyrinogen decarboxylase n=1 Tax=Haematococcus lacustris TaxID=44745 RepID=A0A6A0ACQ4_HAELA|nr:uroporphyrinogen decarboxylase [Haematococcus lacustris]